MPYWSFLGIKIIRRSQQGDWCFVNKMLYPLTQWGLSDGADLISLSPFQIKKPKITNIKSIALFLNQEKEEQMEAKSYLFIFTNGHLEQRSHKHPVMQKDWCGERKKQENLRLGPTGRVQSWEHVALHASEIEHSWVHNFAHFWECSNWELLPVFHVQ